MSGALRFRAAPTLLGAQAATLAEVRAGDVCLLGLFFDAGARFGARFAARQMRYASAGVAAPARCRDLGDLNVFPLEPARHAAALVEQLAMVLDAAGVPVVVGGADGLGPAFAALFGECAVWRPPAAPPGLPARTGLAIDVSALAGDVLRSDWPLCAMRTGLAGLDAARVGGVHVCGLAPALDVSGRREAAVGLHVLAAVVAWLAP